MSLAVMLVDLQRDFIAPDGAYGRAGLSSPRISALPSLLAPVVQSARRAGVRVISCQFTLSPVAGREPIIAADLRRLRPFLGSGDFCPGTPGHGLVDELAPADVVVEKVAYSAFHQSRLEWVLRGLGVDDLLVAGIVTNGGVASTVRDACVRGFSPVLIADGCAAFDDDVHTATVKSLSSIVPTTTASQAAAMLERRQHPARSHE